MRTSVVIGCLLAVVCFVAVESRALSSLEVNANQASPAASAQQVSFQSQSDEVKQDQNKKGQSNDVYYPVYGHPGYPWHYGQYPYHYPGYPYPYHYPYPYPAVHPAVQHPATTVVHPSTVTVHPAVTVQHPVTHHYPYNYPYPYHYPYDYNYWYNNCGYPGCDTHVTQENKENNAKEEEEKNENNDKEDKKSTITH